MSAKGRIDKLAASLDATAEVCTCGPSDMRVRYEGEPVDERPPETCAKCGRPREVVRLRVVYADGVRA
jgi:hypothetical protein